MQAHHFRLSGIVKLTLCCSVDQSVHQPDLGSVREEFMEMLDNLARKGVALDQDDRFLRNDLVRQQLSEVLRKPSFLEEAHRLPNVAAAVCGLSDRLEKGVFRWTARDIAHMTRSTSSVIVALRCSS